VIALKQAGEKLTTLKLALSDMPNLLTKYNQYVRKTGD
jgi:hypothetical protein